MTWQILISENCIRYGFFGTNYLKCLNNFAADCNPENISTRFMTECLMSHVIITLSNNNSGGPHLFTQRFFSFELELTLENLSSCITWILDSTRGWMVVPWVFLYVSLLCCKISCCYFCCNLQFLRRFISRLLCQAHKSDCMFNKQTNK